MVRRSTLSAIALAAILAGPARPAAAEAPAPRLHHAPVSAARAHEPIAIEAAIDHPDRLARASVVYRRADGSLAEVPFERGPGPGYVAVIPARDVKAPAIGYAIEIEPVGGGRTSAFASRGDMQPVPVLRDAVDVREQALLERVDGRRSVTAATAEFVRFGESSGARPLPCAPGGAGCAPGEAKTPAGVPDQYYRIEASYRYRTLRTVAEFGVRVGVVRGSSLVPSDTYDEARYEVGLNYGAPEVVFRLGDAWHLAWELLTSVTETGFSVGTGGELIVGDPYGTKLALGFETIGLDQETYFGTRLFTRMDVVAGSRVTLSPALEITDMPRAEAFGVRLLVEAEAKLGGGFSAAARGGYQARRSTSGGPTIGARVSWAF